MIINGYTLSNEEKVQRAIHGMEIPDRDGNPIQKGGVGEKATPEEILAEYDRIGGLIKNASGDKVKTGSFYNFVLRKVREKPEVMLVFRINEQLIEVPEGEGVPNIVKASRVLSNAKRVKGKEAKTEEQEVDDDQNLIEA